MMAYFKPLRRKLGVLMLVLACTLAGVWIRSAHTVDFVLFNQALPNHAFLSGFGRFRAFQIGKYTFAVDGDERGTKITYKFHRWAPLFAKYDWEPVFQYGDLEARTYPCAVFEAYDDSTGTEKRMWLIPYWSIVIPLTLLSAWLLLSKPRSREAVSPMPVSVS